MEKHKAHYSLDEIKRFLQADCYRFTMSAQKTIQNELGLTEDDAIDVILQLQPRDLYKSMTSLHDHTLWQDVYKPNWEDETLYIKLQILDDSTIVISFKRAEDW